MPDKTTEWEDPTEMQNFFNSKECITLENGILKLNFGIFDRPADPANTDEEMGMIELTSRKEELEKKFEKNLLWVKCYYLRFVILKKLAWNSNHF